MPHLRQSTVGTWKAGPFMDQTSGTGTVTNLTITPNLVRLSKNGANFASKNHAGTGAHDESGFYDLVLDATDTNTLGRLDAFVHNGALPVWTNFEVIEASKYDWLYGTNTQDIGTALAVLSAPDPTGGTIDLAVAINTNNDKTSYSVSSGTLNQLLNINDKTGFSLAADQGAVTIGTVSVAPSSNPTGGTVDLAVVINTNGDKTGYSLSADQSAVSIGTVANALNASNPTGGTVDLAIAINTSGDKTGYSLSADQSSVSIGTVANALNASNPTGGTVDLAIAINTNGDKTGYDLNADQSAVTFGTVQKTLASGNPTGGTVELAIQVNSGTVDAALNAANPSGGTVDLVIGLGADQSGVSIGTVANALNASNPTGGTVDLAIAINTNSDKTGYDLNADQSVVTIGTVGRANSVPNPTGGTVGLSIRTNENVDMIDAEGFAEQETLEAVAENIDDLMNSVSGLENVALSDIEDSIGTALSITTYAEPGQGAPSATSSITNKLGYLHKAWRNKKTHDGTTFSLYDDAGTTVDQKSTDTDDGTTTTSGEITTGA